MPLTSAQIVVASCSVAKCPGFIVQGGQYLNLVLKDLWLHRDLKVNRVTQTINVVANSNGPFNLEADYQRTYDMFYSQNNLPYFLHPVGMDEYDAEFKDPSISNYPYEYATDLSTQAQLASGTAGQVYIYPQSSGLIQITHRYMVKQPEIASPESSSIVPWFEDQDYLIKATARRLFDVTDDQRADKFDIDLERMLHTHLIMQGDDQAVVMQVKLDPRRFHTARALKPVKITG